MQCTPAIIEQTYIVERIERNFIFQKYYVVRGGGYRFSQIQSIVEFPLVSTAHKMADRLIWFYIRDLWCDYVML